VIDLSKIRHQMYFGVVTSVLIVGALSIASYQGVYKFKELTKSIRDRSMELPEAAELGQQVSRLRFLLAQINHETPDLAIPRVDQSDFKLQLMDVESALQDYENQLLTSQISDPRIADKKQETEFVVQFRHKLDRIKRIVEEEDITVWMWHREQLYTPLESELSELQNMAAEIPVFMKERMDRFAERAKSEYRFLEMLLIVSVPAAVTLILLVIWTYHRRIVTPLETLVAGAREVANGNYDHRIDLDSKDEVAELGDAFNLMTTSFQTIQSDLNNQVQQRTKEVVRSEQMASVGFLAAGVAHEINNPLASIAWSAESLESRVEDILSPDSTIDQDQMQSEIDDVKVYLRRIQDEAFRVKGITGSLLDFARMGDAKKTAKSLPELIESVIEIVKPLSKYRRRNIVFRASSQISATIKEQEIKQVLLNLITNALGSVDENGNVSIELIERESMAVIRVKDDGCGMTDEVRKHLFEPFFTRRRDGQGTGLGLSISYQIIEEHGGRIEAHSNGPGTGATFTVTLPLVKNEQLYAKSA
jgi:signal transduction histidine kinase